MQTRDRVGFTHQQNLSGCSIKTTLEGKALFEAIALTQRDDCGLFQIRAAEILRSGGNHVDNSMMD